MTIEQFTERVALRVVLTIVRSYGKKKNLCIELSELPMASGGAKADRFIGNKLPDKQQVQYEHYYQVESIQGLPLVGSVALMEWLPPVGRHRGRPSH